MQLNAVNSSHDQEDTEEEDSPSLEAGQEGPGPA